MWTYYKLNSAVLIVLQSNQSIKKLVTPCAPPTVPTPIKRTPLLSGHLDEVPKVSA